MQSAVPSSSEGPHESDRSSRALGPILVVGLPESGAPILSEALEAAGLGRIQDLKGFPRAIGPLLAEVKRQFDDLGPEYLAAKDLHLIARLEPESVAAEVLAWFCEWLRECSVTESSILVAPEVELGGTTVQSARVFSAVYPQLRILRVRRRAVDGLLSLHRRDPMYHFGNACKTWRESEEAWAAAEAALTAKLLTVHFESLDQQSVETARSICAFLGHAPGKAEALAKAWLRSRLLINPWPLRALPLDRLPWTPERMAEFRALVGPLAEEPASDAGDSGAVRELDLDQTPASDRQGLSLASVSAGGQIAWIPVLRSPERVRFAGVVAESLKRLRVIADRAHEPLEIVFTNRWDGGQLGRYMTSGAPNEIIDLRADWSLFCDVEFRPQRAGGSAIATPLRFALEG